MRTGKQLPTAAQCNHPAVDALYHINKVLYRDWGFAGNSEDFYNPGNSCLSQVISSRSGIPISLAVIYGAICQRLGLRVSGTSYPAVFLLHVHPPSAEAASTAQTASLEGDWVCFYGAEGPEVVRILERDGCLRAIKITGDSNVPAGELTWRTSEIPSQVSAAARVPGEIQLAGHGFTEPVFEAVTVVVWCGGEAKDRVEVIHPKGKQPLVFTRLEPTAPLLIDAFSGGVVMTREQCWRLLKHRQLRRHVMNLSMMDRDQCVAPIENRYVFARMARNLEICYHRSEEHDVSALWGIVDAACSLDGSKNQRTERFGLAVRRFL